MAISKLFTFAVYAFDPSPILADYTERNSWYQKELLKNKSANYGKDKKIEVLTANYSIG